MWTWNTINHGLLDFQLKPLGYLISQVSTRACGLSAKSIMLFSQSVLHKGLWTFSWKHYTVSSISSPWGLVDFQLTTLFYLVSQASTRACGLSVNSITLLGQSSLHKGWWTSRLGHLVTHASIIAGRLFPAETNKQFGPSNVRYLPKTS